MSQLPDRISRLEELARDLWWSWTPEARHVFRRLDYPLWRLTAHNPVRMLRVIAPDTLAQAIANPAWLAQYDRAMARLDETRAARNTWCARECPELAGRSVAYFSAEFALHQSLPIYAGGLGVLAGDHCKEASDLGIPLVGVGFMYPQGYFHQTISADGWQQEVYEKLSWTDAAIEPAMTPDGKPCVTAVPLGSRTVLLAVWRVRAGRVTLYLLDTDLEENAPWDRDLSARLYGGDRETRVQQEILLGVGGVRALKAVGITPAVYHLNEGHAAFAVLQRIRDLCETGWAFEAALEEVRRTTVFTTHTPVAAGHDTFPFHLVEKHLTGAWGEFGPYREKFFALAHHDTGDGPMFNMTALALRTAGATNAVSALHGEVTRRMWSAIWPGTLPERLPVRSVTNGVHASTWISAEIRALLDRYLGPDWIDHHDDPAFCEGVLGIPDEEIWHARQTLRAFLFTFIRERARHRWTKSGASASHIVASGTMFDHTALTIGFARRFTGYKRPDLIFADADRLAHVLNAHGRPVQVLFAGKAHPADDVGKHHLQQIYRRVLDPKFGGRIAFIEDYDLHVAHFLVQGCDVWLNNPRKPLEASGTSGMKAAINGTPHLSIGDGWWAEGFTGDNGWLIDGQADPNDHGAQDWADAQAIYRLIEEELVPTFYDRDANGIPRRWLQVVRQSIRTVLPRFSARRMVKEYVRGMYQPALGQQPVTK
ncbi:MAG: alpha-glucan phosphorylase [Acidobacteria bacterium RIFCSPLOWO2_02_FULL_68_18]|nr:MAG: alpha-glucan phosphorylase [Acidobacteria bacterium RIFCSPLOWO2_02_FULL_68_18]OFW51729.1 MAG: alpha-glucan phosphorylase [Acidobacteria bacterium RIFCSPLOWO2_12_FULL_68_19]